MEIAKIAATRSADADFRARAEAEEELPATIRADLDREWADMDSDRPEFHWPR